MTVRTNSAEPPFIALVVRAVTRIAKNAIVRIVLISSLFVYFWPTVSYKLLLLSFLSLVIRLFCTHAGGHRYFAHRSYDCPAWMKHAMAIVMSTVDMSFFHVWILVHEYHHAHCDEVLDPHSPQHKGFWAVQTGEYGLPEETKLVAMLLSDTQANKLRTAYGTDLSWLNLKVCLLIMISEIGFWILLGPILGFRRFELFYWLNYLPRVLCTHLAYLTNSAAHTFGTKPYCGNGKPPFPNCDGRNCWWAALLNGGEGWHNNHHAFALSARHGLLWWEIDTVYYTLYLMACCGLVWDMKIVCDEIRLKPRDGSLDFNKIERKYEILFPSNC